MNSQKTESLVHVLGHGHEDHFWKILPFTSAFLLVKVVFLDYMVGEQLPRREKVSSLSANKRSLMSLQDGQLDVSRAGSSVQAAHMSRPRSQCPCLGSAFVPYMQSSTRSSLPGYLGKFTFERNINESVWLYPMSTQRWSLHSESVMLFFCSE